MNFKSLVNEICCDNRIKNGVLDLKNEDHVFILQEYLEKAGYNIDEIVEKTAKLFEAGRFPDRQAYNKDGILVTFPNKQYRDRAVNKGTHFAENPKKAQANIFKTDGEQGTDVQSDSEPSDKEPATLDQTLDKDIEGDSGVDKRTPAEKKQDAWGVEAILTGQTPLVNYSVDEAKSYGFYNKGFKWFDTNGNLIGEQIYDETISKNVIVSDAIAPAKYIKKAEKIKDQINVELLSKLDFLKNAEKTQRTLIFETIPILFANGIKTFENLNVSGNYNSYAISFLKEWGNLRAKLEAISDEKARVENIKIYDLVDNDLKEIGGLNGTSLESLGKPTDFIHKDIKKFYTYAEDYNKRFIKEKEGKENTADIVLIYGGSANDVYEALKSGNIEQEDVDSMAKIKNKNVKFALISLKAGSAKLGRVLTQLVSYVGQDIPAVPSKEKPKPLNEGLLDTISQSISTLITKLKGVPDLAKEYYKSFINVINPFTKKISSFFSKELNDNVKQINNSDYKNIQRLENEIEKEIGPVNEAKGKCGKEGAELKDSLFKNMKAFRNILKSDNTDVVLIQKILQYSNNPLLKQNFPILISQEQIESVKNFRSILINLLNSIENDYNVSDCIDRATLNPILKYRANILSLRYIDLILANILKDVNSSDSSKIREEFIKLASVLSTEAVFGNNVSLPLIKFTGKKIEKLKYKRNFKFEVPDKIDDLKLGKLKINIVPDEGYLTVYLYLFNGMVTEDDITVPTYIEYLMKSNSGSAFTFSVEGSKVVEKI